MGKTKDLAIQFQEEMVAIETNLTNGVFNVLDAELYIWKMKADIKKMTQALDEFERDNIEYIKNEIKMHPEGYKGFKIAISDGRKTFDFKNVPEWNEVEYKKKSIETRLKAIVEAKALGSEFADVDENGEQIVLPKINIGKQSITVKQLK